MSKRPTYEDLEKRVRELEKETARFKQIEETLRESERRYRSIYGNAQVGLYRSRLKDGKMLMANHRMAEMFGYKNAEDCVAKYVAVDHYVHPEMRDALVSILCERGEFCNYEVPIRKEDGSVMWLQFSGSLSPVVVGFAAERISLQRSFFYLAAAGVIASLLMTRMLGSVVPHQRKSHTVRVLELMNQLTLYTRYS